MQTIIICVCPLLTEVRIWNQELFCKRLPRVAKLVTGLYRCLGWHRDVHHSNMDKYQDKRIKQREICDSDIQRMKRVTRNDFEQLQVTYPCLPAQEIKERLEERATELEIEDCQEEVENKLGLSSHGDLLLLHQKYKRVKEEYILEMIRKRQETIKRIHTEEFGKCRRDVRKKDTINETEDLQILTQKYPQLTANDIDEILGHRRAEIKEEKEGIRQQRQECSQELKTKQNIDEEACLKQLCDSYDMLSENVLRCLISERMGEIWMETLNKKMMPEEQERMKRKEESKEEGNEDEEGEGRQEVREQEERDKDGNVKGAEGKANESNREEDRVVENEDKENEGQKDRESREEMIESGEEEEESDSPWHSPSKRSIRKSVSIAV